MSKEVEKFVEILKIVIAKKEITPSQSEVYNHLQLFEAINSAVAEYKRTKPSLFRKLLSFWPRMGGMWMMFK